MYSVQFLSLLSLAHSSVFVFVNGTQWISSEFWQKMIRCRLAKNIWMKTNLLLYAPCHWSEANTNAKLIMKNQFITLIIILQCNILLLFSSAIMPPFNVSENIYMNHVVHYNRIHKHDALNDSRKILDVGKITEKCSPFIDVASA